MDILGHRRLLSASAVKNNSVNGNRKMAGTAAKNAKNDVPFRFLFDESVKFSLHFPENARLRQIGHVDECCRRDDDRTEPGASFGPGGVS